jgi:hypothetical protein
MLQCGGVTVWRTKWTDALDNLSSLRRTAIGAAELADTWPTFFCGDKMRRNSFHAGQLRHALHSRTLCAPPVKANLAAKSGMDLALCPAARQWNWRCPQNNARLGLRSAGRTVLMDAWDVAGPRRQHFNHHQK